MKGNEEARSDDPANKITGQKLGIDDLKLEMEKPSPYDPTIDDDIIKAAEEENGNIYIHVPTDKLV